MERNKDARDAKETILPEDDSFFLELGSSFVMATEEEVDQFLDKERKELMMKINNKENELKHLKKDMIQVRTQLKNKFGDHIGLPEIK